jgi:thioredoxin-like negative regulator of GroEL
VSRRLDRRLIAIPVAIIVIAAGGYGVDAFQEAGPVTQPTTEPHTMLGNEEARRAHQSFQQAVAMLQAGEFEFAVTALHDVLAVYPALPEAHVNMGYALLGLGEAGAAADFFDSASTLRPSLHNAYYGLAIAEMELDNKKSALAAMQAFAHRAAPDDRHLPRAQEIIWELQAATKEASP